MIGVSVFVKVEEYSAIHDTWRKLAFFVLYLYSGIMLVARAAGYCGRVAVTLPFLAVGRNAYLVLVSCAVYGYLAL